MVSEPVSQWGIGRLFYMIHDAVIVASLPDCCIVAFNPAAEEMFGHAQREALDKSVELIIHPDYLEAHRTAVDGFNRSGHGNVIDAGGPVLVRGVHCDGHTVWVEMTLSRVNRGDDEYVIAILRDATQRVTTEAATIQRERADAAQRATDAAMAIRDASRRPWWFPRPGDVMTFAALGWMAYGLISPGNIVNATSASRALDSAGGAAAWGWGAAIILVMLLVMYPFRHRGPLFSNLWILSRAVTAFWWAFVAHQVYAGIGVTLFTGLAAVYCLGAIWGASNE